MNEYTYYFKLTTKSPVHIGSSDAYEPTNFVIDNNTLYCFDEIFFYNQLSDTEKQEFARKTSDLFQMINFYRNHKERAKEIALYTCPTTKEIQKQYDKQLNKNNTKNTNQLIIDTTFKNSNTFEPIIPGSSIKGVLDTILDIYPLKSNDTERMKLRKKLQISDAICIKNNTEIGFAYNVHYDIDNNPKKTSVDVKLEVIQPNTEFICSIKSPYDLKILQEKVYYFYSERFDKYQKEQEEKPKEKREDYFEKSSFFEEVEQGFMLKLGKYCGLEYSVDSLENAYRRKKGEFELDEHDKKIPPKTFMLYEYDEKNLNQKNFFGFVELKEIDEKTYQAYLQKIHLKQQEILQKRLKQQQILEQQFKEKEAKEQERERLKKEALEQEKERGLQKLKDKEKKRAEMSPLERKIDELHETKEYKNMSLCAFLLQAIKKGEFDENKKEALEFLKTKMLKENLWKETSEAKNPEKDKKYQQTLRVIEMLKELQ
ncbi:RAMP superfamily CRISPR-associated protein [Helicobacter cetorum]|uniref:RAMP superfamily CRISPR-associated protein n=1 Tax=Helicobacter cetorum TaxID=138563 RepID=UPI000CF12A5B|nr:RAMP superfamily CRISPR-associated protein [Helicobacter cetorum]